MGNIYISYKDALKQGLVKVGAIAVSYPNHKGESFRGEVYRIESDSLWINWFGRPETSSFSRSERLIKSTGKRYEYTDTDLDINLIIIEN